jgi:hypothetical protein
VDLPAPSPPSKVMNLPLDMAPILPVGRLAVNRGEVPKDVF